MTVIVKEYQQESGISYNFIETVSLAWYMLTLLSWLQLSPHGLYHIVWYVFDNGGHCPDLLEPSLALDYKLTWGTRLYCYCYCIVLTAPYCIVLLYCTSCTIIILHCTTTWCSVLLFIVTALYCIVTVLNCCVVLLYCYCSVLH